MKFSFRDTVAPNFGAKIFLVSAILANGAAITSCSRQPTTLSQSQEAAATRSKTEVVLAYFGGFNSCGDPGNPTGLSAMAQFEAVKASLVAAGKSVQQMISCYRGMDSNLIIWQSSLQPDFYSVNWNDPAQNGQLFDEVVLMTDNFRRPLIVVGHSYGGWLASNFAGHLTAKYEFDRASPPIENLLTIDPISPYHCSQVAYAGTVLQWSSPGAVLGRLISGPGPCEQAPPQISQGDGVKYPKQIDNSYNGRVRVLVNQASKSWLNMYQTRDFLHSSAIDSNDGRPENRLISYSNVPVPGTSSSPHVQIHSEGEVWEAISAKVAETIQALR